MSLRCLFATGHWYAPQMKGGAQSSTHELCTELIARGHQVGVLARLRPFTAIAAQHRVRKLVSGRDAIRDDIMGYPVFRCRHLPREAVDDVIARFNPDIAVVQLGNLAPMADALVARRVPVVVYLRDCEFRWYGGTLRRHPLIRYVANSRFTAMRHRAEFGIDSDVIPPLVQPERYRCNGERTHVAFVNPAPEKGAEIVLQLARARPDIPFLVVEGWPMRRSWRRGRADYGSALRHRPNVMWQRSVADMRSVYSRARIVLTPSLWEEAWCRVVTEAQINGIPVLASDRGGLPESVGPGGVIVSHAAPIDEWIDRLSAMWGHAALHESLSRAAAKHARRPGIQPDEIMNRFLAILQTHARRVGNTPSGRSPQHARPTAGMASAT
jgi:glycosyltransferase involved in cell wall biosynthesis